MLLSKRIKMKKEIFLQMSLEKIVITFVALLISKEEM